LFSYIDLVRGEIAFEVEVRFGIVISDEDTDRWRTLGDVARLVVGRAAGVVTEAEVVDWVRVLISEGYGSTTAWTAEDEVFGNYDQVIAWFMAPPYPSRLGDRFFARQQE